MASALTVLLLGCWLAWHSGVWGEHEFPKPTIRVSPSRVVALGGNLTIHCEGLYPGMEFFLRKAGHLNLEVWLVPEGPVAEFPIASVGREDGGSYACDYHCITEPSNSSYLSDPIEIIVAGSSSSCSSRPLVAEAGYCRESGLVSGQRHCQVPCSTHFPAENWAPATLGLRCRHQRPAHPSLPRPSIALSPTGVTAPGADVTIRCQGPRRYMRFFLHKAGDLNPQRHMDPAGAGAEFHIPSVGRQHGGSYSCSYRTWSEPFVSSQPSDPVQLVVAGGTDPTQPGTATAPTRPGSVGPAAPPGRADFTHTNITRLALGAAVLLVLGLILAEACYSRPRGAP